MGSTPVTVRIETVIEPRTGVRAALRRFARAACRGGRLDPADRPARAAGRHALQVPGWFAWGIVVLLLPAVALFAFAALPLLPFAPTRRAGIAIGAVLATLVRLAVGPRVRGGRPG
jgi:hypothetical protein